jgi:hypothetical protein
MHGENAGFRWNRQQMFLSGSVLMLMRQLRPLSVDRPIAIDDLLPSAAEGLVKLHDAEQFIESNLRQR